MASETNGLALKMRWERLTFLLSPVHNQALGTARRLCRSNEDGDGLYQDAVLRAFEKLHTLKDEDRFKSWFFTVLITTHRNRYRRSFWRRFASLSPAGNAAASLAKEAQQGETDALSAMRLRRALERLSPVQREAVVLFTVEGFTIDEIAEIQTATAPAVKSRLVRGRTKLRAHYEKLGFKTRDSENQPMPARELPQGGVR